MIKRALQLPLWAAMIVTLAVSGCGKRLPTDAAKDSGSGYPRLPLVELFTSEYCANCPKADAAAERLAGEMGDSVCLMEMHPITYQASGGLTDSLGIGATDTLAAGYEAGLSPQGLPYFSCDGLIDQTGLGAPDTQSTYLKYRQMVDVRKLTISPLQISLTAQLDQSGIRYSAEIKSDASLASSQDLGLVLAVVEDSVAAYGKQNRYLARRIYPNTKGEPLALAASSSASRAGIIPTTPGWLSYRLTLIAYVRNNSTKEILQSAKVRIVAAINAPAVPSLSLPASGATGISLSPTLSWNASGGAASYTLQYDTDSLFTGGTSQSGLTGTSFKIGGLANSATYYWRVNASNNAGISAWSLWRCFTTTVTALPAAPAPASPANGAIGISRSPALVWHAVSGAAGYDVQVARNNAFAPSAMVGQLSGSADTSFAVSGLDSSTTYYWRVRTVNAAGPSNWSSPAWAFSTTDGLPPSVPSLASPPDGGLNAGTSLSLGWNPGTGATDYSLQISPYSDFRYCVYSRANISGTGQAVGGLDSLTTYYWRVNASNASGTSGWSPAWRFTDSHGYSVSRILVPDTLSWAPDTIITFSLQDTLFQPEIPGFNIYYTNLSGSRISVGTHAPKNLCSDTTLMEGGQLCNTWTCGFPGGPLTDNKWDANNTQHWTVHMTFSVTYPPAGKYSLTLLSWGSDDPSSIMSRKLYLEVLP